MKGIVEDGLNKLFSGVTTGAKQKCVGSDVRK